MQVAPEESRAPKAQGLRRPSAVAGVLVLLRQDRLSLSLLGPTACCTKCWYVVAALRRP